MRESERRREHYGVKIADVSFSENNWEKYDCREICKKEGKKGVM
jgi:hypothetical protein